MKPAGRALLPLLLLAALGPAVCAQQTVAKRVVILKVDGLGADLLARTMAATDPASGRKWLPWLNRIFAERGAIFENFYTRGISLSAPSWSMLDTGSHLLIKGNVEYDRYTGRVYDYLNVFPFYWDYARKRQVDAPSVEVLDDAGVPLLSDGFAYGERFQTPQLFQRGVNWPTLGHALSRRLSPNSLLLLLEDPSGGIGLQEGFTKQTEAELLAAIGNPEIQYLDLFTGNLDHLAHAVNDPGALDDELTKLDALAGRIWSAIEASPLAGQTLFVLVSDHGMNNVPSVFSQTFSLPDLLNSPAGGAHHVVTDRPQLSPYKLQGLNPMLSWVNSPSTASFYLRGQEKNYPTAWLDMDGNERANVSLRNSDLNRLQILIQQLRNPNLSPTVRQATSEYLGVTLDRLRPRWQSDAQALDRALNALHAAIRERQARDKVQTAMQSKSGKEKGDEQAARRSAAELGEWTAQTKRYEGYLLHLNTLAALRPDSPEVLHGNIERLIPPRSLGDSNSIYDLQHYVVGPAAGGFALDSGGHLDQAHSFRYVDYFSLLASQHTRNNPQPGVPGLPIDFVAAALPADEAARAAGLRPGKSPGSLIEAIWLSSGDEHQLVELVCRTGEDRIAVRLIPVAHLRQDERGKLSWETKEWSAGLPFRLFEDPALAANDRSNRGEWLSGWHTEKEWLAAIHRCQYSNGVIGITEQMLPPSQALPPTGDLTGKPLAAPNTSPRELEILQRDLVQPDLQVFANDHWNFNVRDFNPGGNHGSFLRISTHSVWMMAGAGIPAAKQIEEPCDSLNFASTILALLGRPAPLPERVLSMSAP